MKHKGLFIALAFAAATACVTVKPASAPKTAAAPQVAEKKDPIGYKDTPMQPGGKWHIHDIDRPRPAVVTPAAKPGDPPSDAIVLFNGKGLSEWQDTKGQPSKWRVVDGAMECVPKSGYIQTKQKFGDIQLHLEFAAPVPPKGNSQGRGNSGVFFCDGKYEIQVLDSYDNVTYADGQLGAVYGQYPPLVNAARKPGEWQTYDIVFHLPKFDASGKLVKPATVTEFLNGVLMQANVELMGGTEHRRIIPYKAHGKGTLELQDHGNPVRYRNIWVREIKEAAE